MSDCPVCGARYTEEKAEFCSICGWDLTPYPPRAKPSKIYLKQEQVRLQWAKQMWESASNQQNLSARFDELQQKLQQGAIARTQIQSQLEWVLYRLEQLNPELIVNTLLRLEDKISAIADQTPVMSEVGMDYRQLAKLLETGKWRKADEHTWEILLQIAVREDEGWLSAADIDSFPPTDLRTIDQLWQQYSSGRFGLSVQQQIWESVGGKYTELCDRVGWRVKENWKYYSELSFSENAPSGHLPVTAWRQRACYGASQLTAAENFARICAKLATGDA
ncbi:GUN4 domain-containing protein [Microcoleus sp. LEGE 07076]|uniref:GUN4 domain-containing protein n=1 Tax=Microcoleus sp. LEGE 07076 TaxID=915322 RepID=UPI001881E120|nr:GUN4 domain-containing protein [Microcoleus sp. LEGE 07076]MBE9186188.1 GUN4 domain-containing protein [Microcoleus sp. LEGE 07076]